MSRTLDSVVRLWMEGYDFLDIAKKTRISRTSIQAYRRQGVLVLPERPWVTARSMGVYVSVARRWAKDGKVRVGPSGSLYHVDDLRAMLALRERVCANPGCENALDSLNRRIRFCSEHRRAGIDPDRIVQLVAERPGLATSRIYTALGASPSRVRVVLDDMVAEGRLRREEGGGKGGGLRYYVA